MGQNGLVLTRKLGEKIYIGENKEIVLAVVQLDRGKVRIGIEADKQIPIFRSELLGDKDATRAAANQNNAATDS